MDWVISGKWIKLSGDYSICRTGDKNPKFVSVYRPTPEMLYQGWNEEEAIRVCEEHQRKNETA